jgi:hypothetical protein
MKTQGQTAILPTVLCSWLDRSPGRIGGTRDEKPSRKVRSWPTLCFAVGLVFTLSFIEWSYCGSITQVHAENSPQAGASPEEAASNFYKWYLHALYQIPQADPFKEHKSDVDNYVTPRLVQKLANSRRISAVRKGPDVDTEYFFQTLDLNSDWEQNITVSTPTMNGATAVVHLSLGEINPESKRLEIGQDVKVELRKESGVWKIDAVSKWH